MMKSLASELAGTPTGGFAAKHKRLVAALTHAKATTADLPPRLDAGTVASFSFGKGTDAALGGMHAKTLHDGPGGGKWLFKPDKQAKGARAHAVASALLHAGEQFQVRRNLDLTDASCAVCGGCFVLVAWWQRCRNGRFLASVLKLVSAQDNHAPTGRTTR
jgi:hypothetical protein